MEACGCENERKDGGGRLDPRWDSAQCYSYPMIADERSGADGDGRACAAHVGNVDGRQDRRMTDRHLASLGKAGRQAVGDWAFVFRNQASLGIEQVGRQSAARQHGATS